MKERFHYATNTQSLPQEEMRVIILPVLMVPIVDNTLFITQPLHSVKQI